MLALNPAKPVKTPFSMGEGNIYIYRQKDREGERNTSWGEGGSYVADLQPVSVLEKPQGTEGIESASVLGATGSDNPGQASGGREARMGRQPCPACPELTCACIVVSL